MGVLKKKIFYRDNRVVLSEDSYLKKIRRRAKESINEGVISASNWIKSNKRAIVSSITLLASIVTIILGLKSCD